MLVIDHEYPREWAEVQRVEALIAWLRPEVDALWGGGSPDWEYRYRGEDWYVEVTSASVRPREHADAFRRRLEEDPETPTVPSSSGLTGAGVPFETTMVSEHELSAVIAEAVRRKGPGRKRYGNPSRTHLMIDASGDQIADEATALRIAAASALPADYPYAGVFVLFAVRGWTRMFVELHSGR